MSAAPIAAGFYARAVLICQNTGSYCDARNVKALNVIRDEADDEDDALSQLHDAIGDCAYRLRQDGEEAIIEGDCHFDRECGREWVEVADRLDAIVDEIEGAIRARINARLASALWETHAGQVIAAQLAEAA